MTLEKYHINHSPCLIISESGVSVCTRRTPKRRDVRRRKSARRPVSCLRRIGAGSNVHKVIIWEENCTVYKNRRSRFGFWYMASYLQDGIRVILCRKRAATWWVNMKRLLGAYAAVYASSWSIVQSYLLPLSVILMRRYISRMMCRPWSLYGRWRV